MENKGNVNIWGLIAMLFLPFIGMLWFIFDTKKKPKKKEEFGSGEENLYI